MRRMLTQTTWRNSHTTKRWNKFHSFSVLMRKEMTKCCAPSRRSTEKYCRTIPKIQPEKDFYCILLLALFFKIQLDFFLILWDSFFGGKFSIEAWNSECNTSVWSSQLFSFSSKLPSSELLCQFSFESLTSLVANYFLLLFSYIYTLL